MERPAAGQMPIWGMLFQPGWFCLVAGAVLDCANGHQKQDQEKSLQVQAKEKRQQESFAEDGGEDAGPDSCD